MEKKRTSSDALMSTRAERQKLESSQSHRAKQKRQSQNENKVVDHSFKKYYNMIFSSDCRAVQIRSTDHLISIFETSKCVYLNFTDCLIV